MDINAIRSLIADDLNAVNALIQARLRSDVVLINQLATYIINSGGKRLRPMLVLLAGRANGYRPESHAQLAAVIEFIHTATLLHDDVVDASELRRGQDTANSIWGNEASVLVGDFLYTRAFELMVELGNMRVMEVMAKATNAVAAGEVMQLMNCHDPDVSEELYLEVIYRKTGALFEAGCQLAAVLADADTEHQIAMAAYGRHLGTAFQLIDDVLDYTGSSAEIGKNIGDDLVEGKPTLPLIYAMRNGNDSQRSLIRAVIEQGGLDRIEEVHAAVENTGAITYTRRLARVEADRAIESLHCLPDSAHKAALQALADFSVERSA
ncbi:MAG TPA: octaprenyl diphosphate synthase [Gammaproteobacteria bacterium]|nr:octaprenyl diphosphate synthase [Gammaproteobacteria bacterium]